MSLIVYVVSELPSKRLVIYVPPKKQSTQLAAVTATRLLIIVATQPSPKVKTGESFGLTSSAQILFSRSGQRYYSVD